MSLSMNVFMNRQKNVNEIAMISAIVYDQGKSWIIISIYILTRYLVDIQNPPDAQVNPGKSTVIVRPVDRTSLPFDLKDKALRKNISMECCHSEMALLNYLLGKLMRVFDGCVIDF
jgi:hypothetical protein